MGTVCGSSGVGRAPFLTQHAELHVSSQPSGHNLSNPGGLGAGL